MRCTVIVVLCLAVASAKYAKKNRLGQMLQNVVDFGNEVEHDVEDTWSDDDSDESDEDMWQEPHHHYQPRQTKRQPRQRPQITDTHKQRKWQEEEDDEYESHEDDFNQKKQKKQHRREHEQDEPKQQCQPKYELLQKLDQINAQLAARLHQETKQMDDDKNTVVSPVSVQLALAALAQGAHGNTKKQLSQLLDFGMSKNQNQNAYAALTRALKGQGPDQSGSKSAQIISTINLVLGQESAQEQFIESIKTCFDGEVKKCDFRQKSQQCRDQINQWVASKTGKKFQNALSQAAVTSTTKMVSIGTMQLKANWGKQFRKNQKAVQGQFYPLGDQKPTSVKVLQSEGDFNYYEDEQLQIVGVPTQEKQLTMYVILPKNRHGLHQVEKRRLQYGKQLEQLLGQCDSKKLTMKVQVPTFQIVHKTDAKQTLRKMGVEDAFDSDAADFSGVSDQVETENVLNYGRRHTGGLEDIDVKKAVQQQKEHQIHLNKLIQLATIQVDENGISEASGHGVQASKLKPSKSDSDDEKEEYEKNDRIQFQADHAFVFVVKHNPTNQLLLIGRVVDATQKAESGLHTGNESQGE